ncbi:hypothetical protein ACFX14_007605 [Malus domestica]
MILLMHQVLSAIKMSDVELEFLSSSLTTYKYPLAVATTGPACSFAFSPVSTNILVPSSPPAPNDPAIQ